MTYVFDETLADDAVLQAVPVEAVFQIDQETLLELVDGLQVAENGRDALLAEQIRPAAHRNQVALAKKKNDATNSFTIEIRKKKKRLNKRLTSTRSLRSLT